MAVALLFCRVSRRELRRIGRRRTRPALWIRWMRK